MKKLLVAVALTLVPVAGLAGPCTLEVVCVKGLAKGETQAANDLGGLAIAVPQSRATLERSQYVPPRYEPAGPASVPPIPQEEEEPMIQADSSVSTVGTRRQVVDGGGVFNE